MSHLQLVPSEDAFAHARFTELYDLPPVAPVDRKAIGSEPTPFRGFHGVPRAKPLARVAIGGKSATAQLDRSVQRLRARDELLLTDVVYDQPGDTRFFRRLTAGLGVLLLCWIALGILFAWWAGRL